MVAWQWLKLRSCVPSLVLLGVAEILPDVMPSSVPACCQVYAEGKMSQYMDKMVLGDCLDFKGPKGRFTYQPNTKRAIGAYCLHCNLSAD